MEDEHFIEWFSYYLVQGVDKFILITHFVPGDEPSKAREWILKLKEYYDIEHRDVVEEPVPIYINPKIEMQKILDTVRHEYDWLIFADSDEYYFPLEKDTIKEVLYDYQDKHMSALGVYWLFFGSSGIHNEPEILTKSFTKRSNFDWDRNHHMKCIVKGNKAGNIAYTNPHVFTTEYETYDLEGRLIPNYCGWNHTDIMRGLYDVHCPGVVTHNIMRINHYYTHSYDWFQRIKKRRGPGDGHPHPVDDHFHIHDTNDVEDDSLWIKYGDRILEKMYIVKKQLGIA
jgi:hypothetical protein